jgi:hypothetical protein
MSLNSHFYGQSGISSIFNFCRRPSFSTKSCETAYRIEMLAEYPFVRNKSTTSCIFAYFPGKFCAPWLVWDSVYDHYSVGRQCGIHMACVLTGKVFIVHLLVVIPTCTVCFGHKMGSCLKPLL